MWSLLFSYVICFNIVLPVSALTSPITINGTNFVYSNGTRYIIRGLFYSDSGRAGVESLSFIDVLGEESYCSRDIPYFQQLGINTIVIYDVNPTLDRTYCMSRLADAGISVLIQLNGIRKSSFNFFGHIITTWDYQSFDFFDKVVDAYQAFPNTLGFFIGIHNKGTYGLSHGKTAMGSVKEHIQSKGYRNIPVGFLNQAFEPDLPGGIGDFLNCGNAASSADFLIVGRFLEGVSFCVDESTLLRGDLVQQYSKFSIPSVLIYGCAAGTHHDYAEVQTLFGNNVTRVFSGAVVQEFYNEVNTGADMGLIDVAGSNNLSIRPEFRALSSQFARLAPPDQTKPAISPDVTRPTMCATATLTNISPTVVSSVTSAVTSLYTTSPKLAFRPNHRLCSCMVDTLGCIADPSWNTSALYEVASNACEGNGATETLQCTGIDKWPKMGIFGSYSGCNNTEQASWVLNTLFVQRGRDPKACADLGGILKEPVKENRQAPGCGVLLKQVGERAQGSISYMPPEATAGSSARHLGLTTGMKAGIGVAVALALTIFCSALGMFCILSKRREKRRKAEALTRDLKSDGAEGGSRDGDMKGIPNAHEVDGAERMELDSDHVIQELDIDKELETLQAAGVEIEDTGKYVFEMDGETVEDKRLRQKREREIRFNGVEEPGLT